LGVEKLVKSFNEICGSTSGGLEGGIGSYFLSISASGDTSTYSSKTSSEMAIKCFGSLHLFPGNYLSSKL